jgi:hypothetical protein
MPEQVKETNADMPGRLTRVARFPHLRALAWSGDHLYASCGYELLRARIQTPVPDQIENDSIWQDLAWQPVAKLLPALRRRLSVMNPLTARLFRDGFHALAVLPSGGLVAAVPGAIITLSPGESIFRCTHTILRGTRPLHITALPDGGAGNRTNGAIYWGEYFDNPARDAVHIYASTDAGATWSVAYTFPKGAIRHVHNIVHDPWQDCLWILTGDYGDECRILRATCDFSHVESVLQGRQQARAVAAIPTEHGLYFSSDTPLESNYIYRLDRQNLHRQNLDRHEELLQVAPLSSSSIYGCRVGSHVFFSTMVEPSEVNRDRHVRVYAGKIASEVDSSSASAWQPLLSWKKDAWPMGLFQYGNALMPDGINATPFLALTTIAVESDNQVTSLYSVAP